MSVMPIPIACAAKSSALTLSTADGTRAPIGLCVAAPGSTMPTTAARRTATGTSRRTNRNNNLGFRLPSTDQRPLGAVLRMAPLCIRSVQPRRACAGTSWTKSPKSPASSNYGEGLRGCLSCDFLNVSLNTT